MKIGVPREIKTHEYRAALTPAGARELSAAGHTVLVQQGLGAGIGVSDADYVRAGAEVVASAEDIFARSELVLKVKEPQPQEVAMLRPGQVLFTYLHLASDPVMSRALMESGAVCIAYETVTDAQGGLPLLAPMSEVAGRMALQVGASLLEKPNGGRGVLLGGVPGVPAGRVVVLGAGIVGSQAMRIAVGLGAEVVVVDRNVARLRQLDALYGNRIATRYSSIDALEQALHSADLVIGTVLVPGDAAPRLVSREMLAGMQPGSVVVDVAIDQGGCFATSRPTTHADPTYEVDGVLHYCVTNMPGAVPRSSSFALTHATLPMVMSLAGRGWERAMREDPHLAAGLNICEGRITHPGVAHALGLPCEPLKH